MFALVGYQSLKNISAPVIGILSFFPRRWISWIIVNFLPRNLNVFLNCSTTLAKNFGFLGKRNKKSFVETLQFQLKFNHFIGFLK